MRLLSTILPLGPLLIPAIASSQALARAPGARVVTVSPFGMEEPSIAVNPKSPNQVVVAYQGNAATSYSTDSGRTFAPSSGTDDPGFIRRGDVVLAFSNKGHAFLSYVAFDKQGTPFYWGHGSGKSAVVVRRSVDGGKSWEPTDFIVNAPPVTENTPFQDMERIFADNGVHSPHAGNLYIGWIEWRLKESVMLFSRSEDDGETWSKPIQISTRPGLPRDGNGDVVGFEGTVGSDGTIYTVWHEAHYVTFASSHDGGKTFEPSRRIIKTGPPYMGAIMGLGPIFGAMGFPQIGVDPKNSNLYVTWSDYRNGDIDIFLSRSVDHGKTWSPPQRVNDDPAHDGADQYFQWMTVDPVTGAIYVQFYDRRADPKDYVNSVTLARSTDGGHTFVNYEWADQRFEGHDVRLGDYMWLVAYDNRVYGTWSEPIAADTGAHAHYVPVVKVGTADFSH